MLRQLLENNALPGVALALLVFFASLFTAMVIWIFRRKNKEKFKNISKLPLEEDEKHVPKTDG